MTDNEDLAESSRRLQSGIRPVQGRKVQEAPPEVAKGGNGSASPGFVERRAEKRGRRKDDALPPLKTPPVLIATSDPSLSRMLGFALEQMQLEYKEANTGPATLNELMQMEVGAQPPVIVLDVDLPGMDGHAILERIGVHRPDTFLILVLSSHADESVQVRSLLAGAVDHLPKPFNVRILMAKVHRWVVMSAKLAGRA